MEHLHVDPAAPGRLRYPTPVLAHRNYPGYTPSGRDRRWVNELELERSDVKWVGNMMYDTYPLTRFLRSGTDGFFFQGWWLNSSVPIPWNLGLDRPNYKTQILWSDQAVTSTHRCAGRIWAQSRHGSMNISRRSSTEWAWATDGGGYVIALTRGSAPVRHSIIITPLFAGLSGHGIIFSENSHWRPLTRNQTLSHGCDFLLSLVIADHQSIRSDSTKGNFADIDSFKTISTPSETRLLAVQDMLRPPDIKEFHFTCPIPRSIPSPRFPPPPYFFFPRSLWCRDESRA